MAAKYGLTPFTCCITKPPDALCRRVSAKRNSLNLHVRLCSYKICIYNYLTKLILQIETLESKKGINKLSWIIMWWWYVMVTLEKWYNGLVYRIRVGVEVVQTTERQILPIKYSDNVTIALLTILQGKLQKSDSVWERTFGIWLKLNYSLAINDSARRSVSRTLIICFYHAACRLPYLNDEGGGFNTHQEITLNDLGAKIFCFSICPP